MSAPCWLYVLIPSPKKEAAIRNERESKADESPQNREDEPCKVKIITEEAEDDVKAHEDEQTEFIAPDTFKLKLSDAFQVLQIEEHVKHKTSSGDYLLYIFCVPFDQVEATLVCLQKRGIGNSPFTSISVLNSAIHVSQQQQGDKDFGDKDDDESESGDGKFIDSIKSRLLVAEVVNRIQAGSEFTFDFLMFLILAACIAFFGLLENSSVVLVASMLVSPIMGPILAGIFGAVIKDDALRDKSVVRELISLSVCILIGFVLGVIFVPWIDTYGVEKWPTVEMTSRGQLRSLLVGILIAVPSGAGVALSVLGGNAASLVGVAISASLLPPAVNCGLFLANSLVVLCSSTPYVNDYSPVYSEHLAAEFAVLGIISFALTLVNIVCIVIVGVAILKLKEVTPEKIPQSFNHFWKQDVRAHRDYLQTINKGADPYGENLLEQARNVLGIGMANNDGLDGTFLQGVFEGDASIENDLIDIRKWVAQPCTPGAAPTAKQPKFFPPSNHKPRLRSVTFSVNRV